MIKKITAVAILILSALGLRGANAAEPKVSTSSRVLTSYVVDGTVFYDRPVIQNDLTVTWENGLSLNLWHSSDFEDGFGSFSNTGADEIDYTLGYTRQVCGFELGVSVAYYDLVDLGEDDGDIWSLIMTA